MTLTRARKHDHYSKPDHHYRRRRFAWLVLLAPAHDGRRAGACGAWIQHQIHGDFPGLNILAAVLGMLSSSESYLSRMVVGLLLLIMPARGSYALFGYERLLMTAQGAGALTCLVTVFVLLRHVLREGHVTSESIFAALNVYLMLGIICGVLFFIFEESWPGSFSFQGSSSPGSKSIQLADTIYFSFVTLGTLGYGDFIPISGPTRALAVLEAIVGQMYLVVVVSRLVSLYKGGTRPEGS